MHLRPFLRFVCASLALVVAATACQNGDSTSGTSSSSSVTSSVSTEAFDDHTVGRFDSIAEVEGFGVVDASRIAVKFAIPDLDAPGVVWLDGSFYELHDEWYWFRLLNGRSVPGLDTDPVPPGSGPTFSTINEVYAWASARPSDLPLDLRFAADGERLYSDRYYDLALRDRDKTYGLGTLVRFETATGDRWVIEMEFSEAATPDSVTKFIDRVAESLPSDIGDDLGWVVRSPGQEDVARTMVEQNHPYRDRIVRYADLVEQGEVEVYNPGLAAGRLRLIEDADDLNLATSTDILVMERVPDWLPPASGMLTSAPQTPLAHVNLLARNRGIPNVSVAGLLDDPAIAIAARSRAYAVIGAGPDNELRVTLITREQFETWNDLRSPEAIVVPAVDVASMPTVMSLVELAVGIRSEADVEALRPSIGGKSAGFLALIAADGVTTPDSPLAITVAPYVRHLEQVGAELEAMLADDDFRTDARARFLLLEGPGAYAETYTSDRDAAFAVSFDDRQPTGPIRTILDADGFVDLFRSVDMIEADLDTITEALRSNFGELGETQGLRFRSSSSVEDIEGFTGAGLYDSNTGFLKPELQTDEGDHKKTVERTIKKTWASYWGFEAFEERRLENVDHRSGGMGVLVHPRFDDEQEMNNGVATLTLLPEGHDDRLHVLINVQLGDVSVANPAVDTDVLPEQILARVSSQGGLVQIERKASSTLVDDGEVVLDDEAVSELLSQLSAVGRLWRDRVNADLPVEQQVQIVTLDFEFKTMAAGWPALVDGSVRPARLVVKQARSLDPGMRAIPAAVLALPIPRDVLARAILVEEITCDGGATGIEVVTGTTMTSDVGSRPGWLRISETPDALDGDDCERVALVRTPERILLEFLESGDGLEIG